MFGNKLGWGISAVLAIVILWSVWQIGQLNAMSPVSTGVVARTGNVALNLGTRPQILDPIVLPFDPKGVLPSMTDAADAAPLYRQVIEKYTAAKNDYDYLFDKKTGKPKTLNYKDLPAFDLLVQARNSGSMKLFQATPEEVINYTSYPPAIDALANTGRVAFDLAFYIKDENKADAMLLAEAVFSLGVKMAEERLRYCEFKAGADLLRDGALLIAKLDPSRAGAPTVDAGMRALLKDRCIPLWTVINSLDQDVIGRSAGDVFYIAKNSKERLWRIEATLKLGRYKHNSGEGGRGADQRWAGRTAKRWAADASLDPAVRAAAKAANELTLERYNMLGG